MARESCLVSEISAGDGKIANIFSQCNTNVPFLEHKTAWTWAVCACRAWPLWCLASPLCHHVIALTQRTFGALISSLHKVLDNFCHLWNVVLYHQEPTLLSLSPVGDLRIFSCAVFSIGVWISSFTAKVGRKKNPLKTWTHKCQASKKFKQAARSRSNKPSQFPLNQSRFICKTHC